MNNCDHIFHYFPELNSEQKTLLNQFARLFEGKNLVINLISRKDIEHLCIKHILHSLTISHFVKFKKGTNILDVGTGGGFPGIPLAIMFPEVHFILIDSIGKKIKAVNEIVEALGLRNVKAQKVRAEDLEGEFDFVVSRAVTALPKFCGWVMGKIRKRSINDLKNGILYLKGGDIAEEISQTKLKSRAWELKDYFQEDFFETKKLIHLFR